MHAYFNELSTVPHVPSIAVDRAMDGFIDTCCTLLKSGIRKIVCSDGPGSILISESATMHDYCVGNMRDNRVRLLISNFTKPYLVEDTTEETQFIEKNFIINIVDANGKEREIVNPMGISSAHLYGALVVSFASSEFWKNSKRLTLKVIEEHRSTDAHLFNISEPSDVNGSVKNLIASKSERNWVRSKTAPDRKVINLSSDHHGNDKLEVFAKRSLRPLDYFEEVSTSLAYDNRCDHFVKALDTDSMQIDVVLFWEEPGVSMRIKTTARNEMELRQQAQDLEARFGKRR